MPTDSNIELAQRVTRVEAGFETIASTIKEIKDQLVSLNNNTPQVHQMNSLLEQLSSKISNETTQLRTVIEVHINKSESTWLRMEDKHTALGKEVAQDKAYINGRIAGVRNTAGVIGLICGLCISVGAWIVNRELGNVDSEKAKREHIQEQIYELREQVSRLQAKGN